MKAADIQFGSKGVRRCRRSSDTGIGVGEACGLIEKKLCIIYVTVPGKTGLIYTKYTCLYYGIYLPFSKRYLRSVSFIEFLMDFCILYDDILNTIQITDKSYYILNSQNQIKCYMYIRPVFPVPVTWWSHSITRVLTNTLATWFACLLIMYMLLN